jgi:hypothetical protein
MFRVGMKVVCVDGEYSGSLVRQTLGGDEYEVPMPKRETIYTIRDIEFQSESVCAVRLEEIVNPICRSISDGVMEPNYRSTRFRPVVERKTDISLFTAMLNPTKQKERV